MSKTGPGRPQVSGSSFVAKSAAFMVLAAVSAAFAQPQALYLIPRPVEVQRLPGSFEFAEDAFIEADSPARELLVQQLTEEAKLCLGIEIGRRQRKPIRIKVDPEVGPTLNAPTTELANQGYLLEVDPQRISITAPTEHGAFYGVQTLRQLIRGNRDGTGIPAVRIRDYPLLPLRGFRLSLTHESPPTLEFLERQIRVAAELKLNAFQWADGPDRRVSPAEAQRLADLARQYHMAVLGEIVDGLMSGPEASLWDGLYPDFEAMRRHLVNTSRAAANAIWRGVAIDLPAGAEQLLNSAWYGLGLAAECAWRAGESDMAGLDESFARCFFGQEAASAAEALAILRQLRGIPGAGGMRIETFFTPPSLTELTTFADAERRAQALTGLASRAVELASSARQAALQNADGLEALRFAAQRARFMGEACFRYRRAAQLYDQAYRERDRGLADLALYEVRWCAEEAARLRDDHEHLWHLERNPQGWRVQEARYEPLIQFFRDKVRIIADALDRPTMPRPALIGLQLAELGRRPVDAVVVTEPMTLSDKWWDRRWPYRLGLRIHAGMRGRADVPVEVELDLARYLRGPLDLLSVHVALEGQLVPSQYDPAQKRLLFVARGEMRPASVRTYEVYFDEQRRTPKPRIEFGGVAIAHGADGTVRLDNNRLQVLLDPANPLELGWQMTDAKGVLRTGSVGFEPVTTPLSGPARLERLLSGPVAARYRCVFPQGPSYCVSLYSGAGWFEVLWDNPVERIRTLMEGHGDTDMHRIGRTYFFSDGTSGSIFGPLGRSQVLCNSVSWGAIVGGDGLSLGLVMPEVECPMLVGPTAQGTGLAVEGAGLAAHFIVLADTMKPWRPEALETLRRSLNFAQPVAVEVADRAESGIIVGAGPHAENGVVVVVRSA